MANHRVTKYSSTASFELVFYGCFINRSDLPLIVSMWFHITTGDKRDYNTYYIDKGFSPSNISRLSMWISMDAICGCCFFKNLQRNKFLTGHTASHLLGYAYCGNNKKINITASLFFHFSSYTLIFDKN